ncbi:MAG: hypothetical protein QOG80_2427 [Pseudonocardiales bacterium]|nr:hypothetical protein [Pseudonocardiales bacterium]
MATAALVAGCLFAALSLQAGPAGAAAAPGLVLHPSQGPPNSVVSFGGSGFCARASCGAVSISFNNNVVAAPVHVAADGSITGAFSVPSGPNGWQRVVASQRGASLSATALYFVGTSLPAPTGPQPTVTYQPAPASVPVVQGTVAATPVTTPPTAAPTSSPPSSGPATSAATGTAPEAPSLAPAADDKAKQTGVSWGWGVLIAALVLAAAATVVAAIRRNRNRPVES